MGIKEGGKEKTGFNGFLAIRVLVVSKSYMGDNNGLAAHKFSLFMAIQTTKATFIYRMHAFWRLFWWENYSRLCKTDPLLEYQSTP